MPLKKVNVPVVFDELDLDNPDELVLPTSLTKVENCVWTGRNELSRRGAFEAWKDTSTTDDNDGVTGDWMAGDSLAGLHLMRFQDEMLATDGTWLRSMPQNPDVIRTRGYLKECIVETHPVGRSELDSFGTDIAETDDLRCMVGDQVGRTVYWVQDKTTGAYLVNGAELVSDQTRARVVAMGDDFFAVWGDGFANELKVRKILGSDPTAAPAAATPRTDVASFRIDAIVDGSEIWVCYETTGTGVNAVQLDSSMAVVGGPLNFGTATDGNTAVSWSTRRDDSISQNVCLMSSSVDGVRGQFITRSTFVLFGVVVAIDAGATSADHVVGWHDGSFFADVHTYYTVSNLTRHLTRTKTVGGSTTNEWLRSVGIASRIAFHGERPMLLVAAHSDRQPTYFLVDCQSSLTSTDEFFRRVIARILPLEGSSEQIPVGWVPSLIVDGDRATTMVQRRINVVFDKDGDIVDENNGADRVEILFGHEAKLGRPVEFQNALLIPGGCPKIYDGQYLTEVGFHLGPEKPASAVNTASGNVPVGDTEYVVVGKWFHPSGTESVSTPSPSIAHTVAGSAQRVEVTAYTIRVTDKTSAHADGLSSTSGGRVIADVPEIQLDLYRLASDGLFHRVPPTAPGVPTIANDPTADTVVLSDNATDLDLLAGEILYTEGGVVANRAPPSSRDVAVLESRPFFVASETPTVWVGRVAREGFTAEFSAALRLPIGRGKIIGCEPMDQRLVIFQADANRVLNGLGPTATGENQYDSPPAVETQSPLADPRTIVPTPDGLMYYSTAGIRLLTRGLSIVDVGAKIRGATSLAGGGAVRAATIDPINDRAIFYVQHPSGTDEAMVYTWRYKDKQGVGRWTTWTLAFGNATDIVTFPGSVSQHDIHVFHDSGSVRRPSGDFVGSEGLTRRPVIQTADIPLAKLGGRLRVYRIRMYLGGITVADVDVRLRFDGRSTSTVVEVDEASAAEPLRYDVRPSVRKCESISIQITPQNDTAFRFHGLALVVGRRPGHKRGQEGKVF